MVLPVMVVLQSAPVHARIMAAATFPEYPQDLEPDPWTVGTLYAGWSEESGFDAGGSVSLDEGSGFLAGTVYLGYGALGSGSLTARGQNPLTGTSSQITVTQTLVVGEAGEGDVALHQGADMTTGVVVIGNGGFSNASGDWARGQISIGGGPDSLWTTTSVYVGVMGRGEVEVVGGSRVESGDTFLGYLHPPFADSGRGKVLVRTAGVWDNSGLFSVGYQGVGELTVQGQGIVDSRSAQITQDFTQTERSLAVVENAGSRWTIDETFHVGGELRVRAGGLVQNGGDAKISWDGLRSLATVEDPGSRWENAAVLSIGGTTSTSETGELHIKNAGVVTAQHGYLHNGFAYVNGAGSRWTLSDQLHVGRTGTSAHMEVLQGGLAECQFAFIGTFIGSGELRLTDAGSRLVVARDLQIGGDFAGSDNQLLLLPGGEAEVGDALTVGRRGAVSLQPGSRLAADQINLAAVDSVFSFNGGRLETRAFSGDLVNLAGGTLAPGHAPMFPQAATAIVPLSNYHQDGLSTLEIEIGGGIPGLQHDRLDVGQLQLGGTLEVKLIAGYSPPAGASFDILNWASLSGTFDALSLPMLPGPLVWYTAQLYTTGRLWVVGPPVPADFDADFDVDGDDLAAFQACSSGPTIPAKPECAAKDLDTDGDVDQSDFGRFQRCYSAASTPADPNCAN